ncbi:hypothetical protein [Gordonia paraffinivorans]|uniref:hypothetical protein n=1 Tax=Gordonia paraffinivorans TaxID=175628 RepID=UPI0011B275AB|nr:hypothetical protein [Gordonia paraffinivorans]
MANEEAVADKLVDALSEVRTLHYEAQKAILQRIISDAETTSGDHLRALAEGAALLADAVPRIRPTTAR